MSANVGNQINTASGSTDTWQHALDRLNALINAAATIVVTAEALPNGSPTTGNAYVNGVMGVVTLAVGTALRGGNVQSSAALPVTTNVAVGNVLIQLNEVGIGNSTVNAIVNSTHVTAANGLFSDRIGVGGNVYLNSSAIFIGNSTVNTVINSSSIVLGGSALISNATKDSVAVEGVLIANAGRVNFISGTDVTIDASYDSGAGQVNVTISAVAEAAAPSGPNTGILFNGSGAFLSNSSFTFDYTTKRVVHDGTYQWGNSTVNSIANSTVMTVGNSTLYTSQNSTVISVGNSTAVTNVKTSAIELGANVLINTTAYGIGNTTVNSTMNSTVMTMAEAVRIASNLITLDSNAISFGNSTVNTVINATTINTATGQFSTTVNTALVTTSRLYAGNSTVNATINATDIYVTGNVRATDRLLIGANVTVNATHFSVGNATVNAIINSSAVVTDGATLRSAVSIGNSTVNVFTNSISMTLGVTVVNTTTVYVGNSTVNAIVNSSVLLIGAAARVNSTAFSIGSTTVNSDAVTSTSVNATGVTATSDVTIGNSSINVAITKAGGVSVNGGAAVVNSTTVKVGTNVYANQSHLFVGNSTVNVVINSSTIYISGSSVAQVSKKNTVWVPAGAMVGRTTSGAAEGLLETTTNKVMVKTLDFDATTQEFAQFTVRMPKSWNLGTVTFSPVWAHPSTSTNFGVAWALQAVSLGDGSALDTAFGTEQVITDTGGTTDTAYHGNESSAITIAGSLAAKDLVMFQIKRVPSNESDNLAVDARLIGVHVYYTTNAIDDT